VKKTLAFFASVRYAVPCLLAIIMAFPCCGRIQFVISTLSWMEIVFAGSPKWPSFLRFLASRSCQRIYTSFIRMLLSYLINSSTVGLIYFFFVLVNVEVGVFSLTLKAISLLTSGVGEGKAYCFKTTNR